MSKKTGKKEALKQRQWEAESEQFKYMQSEGLRIKPYLRSKGCNLPFYDFLDSYTEEFEKIVKEAKEKYPSLLGVHEVDEHVYRKTDWAALGYGAHKQIFFSITDSAIDYGKHGGQENLCGSTTAFLDSQQRVRTAVIIRKAVKNVNHREKKYAFKIPALLHEIGHVHDIEHGINFNITAEKADIIEAEVFANLYALDRMAERQLVQSYNLLLDALRKATTADGYIGQVGKRLVERLPEHKLVNWNDYIDSDNLTPEDVKLYKKGLI